MTTKELYTTTIQDILKNSGRLLETSVNLPADQQETIFNPPTHPPLHSPFDLFPSTLF